MPVIGLTFSSIEANRKKGSIQGEIKVNSTPRIIEMKEISVATLEKKALSLTFEFITSYSSDMGEIKIGGELLYLPGKEKNATILSQWKKKKRLPEKVSIEVLNHLFRRCLLKIANIAEDLQLPPPLQLPRVKPADQQDSGYVG